MSFSRAAETFAAIQAFITSAIADRQMAASRTGRGIFLEVLGNVADAGDDSHPFGGTAMTVAIAMGGFIGG